ncbi:uncharacterized protein F5891DRAFT_980971 [Suillus fuscotomentosus]|uniref:Uncharacterized protein n=1 Tax=Suillus fuscotomentosus TaxID=1912939 RepID=A0AAD4HJB6_9AGAM|nr:uncharacterized protein F5891DRAFT_980971 [Suillus fuscotomentosus]KAG1899745.1 hypothetical protein F5891DRAFT_980971 [Suillus fuscotomentosus]
MALICRHDHVLWMVNLTSMGEKQHYALALLDRLFKHIPAWMTIRLLYDIACQLEWSCRKWKFMDDSILSHITFAVAVFHAYGHQWPCQVIYHPRKQEGFGLSDGEGCEGLWSFLKPLIPSLCVSGIHHLDSKSLQGFGHWLHQHWIHCQTKKNDALDLLHNLQLDEDMLCLEWKAQVDHQTRPTPCINKAAEVITTILALEKTLEVQETSIHELEMQLHGDHVPNIGEVNLQLVDARSQHRKTADTLRRQQAALGMDDKDQPGEDEEGHISYTEHKLHANTQHLIKHQEPGILKLRRAPPSAVPPHIIQHDGIFQLDVNDDIWQDIGLDDDTLNPPAWLLDDMVRNGIRLQLEVNQCNEEEARLMGERAVIQEWMLAEWDSIQAALDEAVADAVMSFHLKSHADDLVDICVVWKKKVQSNLCTWPLSASWGPSDKALHQAAYNQVQSSFHDNNNNNQSMEGDGEGDCKSELEYGEIEDEKLIDAIEEIALADECRYGQDMEFMDNFNDIDNDFMPSSPIMLLHKRRRM